MPSIWEKLKNAASHIVFPLGGKLNLGKSLNVKNNCLFRKETLLIDTHVVSNTISLNKNPSFFRLPKQLLVSTISGTIITN